MNKKEIYDISNLGLIATVLRQGNVLPKPEVCYDLQPELHFNLQVIMGYEMSEASANDVKHLFAAYGFRIIPSTYEHAKDEMWSTDKKWCEEVIRQLGQSIVCAISKGSNSTLKEHYSNANRMEATIREFVDRLHRFGHVLSKAKE